MRPVVGTCSSLFVRSIALAAILALVPSAFSQQQYSPVFRGTGVQYRPAEIPRQADAQQPFVYVVAGDVHSPGVFTSSRPTVPAEELIERAGGSSSLYVPMVHRVVRGIRVTERRWQTQADGWEFANSDVLQVVERDGVRDVRRQPPFQGSHAVCYGLSALPVVVHLPEGRTSIGDLLNILGQPQELLSQMQVLPVRVIPRVVPDRIEPGTVVHFPAHIVNANLIPPGVVSPPVPLETEAATITPPPAASEILPAPSEESTPSLLPSYAVPVQPQSNPLSVPFAADGPTAWAPSTNMYVPGSGRIETQEEIEVTSAIHEITQSQSQVVTEDDTPASMPDVAGSTTPLANEATTRTASPLSQAAIYTGGLAVVCLVLAGIWTYWDQMRSIALTRSFTRSAPKTAKPQAVYVPQPLHAVQALIDNRLPIVEETVDPPKSIHFQGEAVGQRRMRLDCSHALAGPHAAFAAGQSDEASVTVGVGELQSSADHQARESRQLQRLLAHLTVGQRRGGGRRTAKVSESFPTAEEPSTTPSRAEREGALERALRQVMRKARS